MRYMAKIDIYAVATVSFGVISAVATNAGPHVLVLVGPDHVCLSGRCAGIHVAEVLLPE